MHKIFILLSCAALCGLLPSCSSLYPNATDPWDALIDGAAKAQADIAKITASGQAVTPQP